MEQKDPLVEFALEVVKYAHARRREMIPLWDAADEQYDHELEESAFMPGQPDFVPRSGWAFQMVKGVKAEVLNRYPVFQTATENPRVGPLAGVLKDLAVQDYYLGRALRGVFASAVQDTLLHGGSFLMSSIEASRRSRLRSGDPMDVQRASVRAELAIEKARRAQRPKSWTYDEDDRVLRGEVATRWMPIRRMILDADMPSVEESQYIGYDCAPTIEALRHHFGDKALAGVDTVDDRSMGQYIEGWLPYENRQSPIRRVPLHILFIREASSWIRLHVLPHNMRLLIEPEDSPFVGGHTFRHLVWNEDGTSIYAQSDLKPAWTTMLEEELVMEKTSDAIMRAVVNKIIYNKKQIKDQAALARLMMPDVDAAVGFDGLPDDFPIERALFRLESNEKLGEMLAYRQMLRGDLEIGSGRGPNQQGQPMRSGTSASEAGIVEQRARLRNADRFDRVEDVVSEVMTDRAILQVQYLNSETIARRLGADAARIWETTPIDDYDLQRQLYLRVRQGSMRPVNEDAMIQRADGFAQAAMLNPAIAAAVDWVKWLKLRHELSGFDESNSLLLPGVTGDAISRSLVALQQGLGGGAASPPTLGPTAESAGALTQAAQG